MPNLNDPYNPYIHGTTFHALHAMAQTDYSIVPVLTLLDEYQLAPGTGEITAGGFDNIGSDFIFDAFSGAISFGTLHPEAHHFGNGYDLNKVIKSYTQFNSIKTESNDIYLQQQYDLLFETNFNNFHLFLIYYTRARQLNPNKKNILSEMQLNKIKHELAKQKKLYQFFELLMSGDIIVNKEEIKKIYSEKKFKSYGDLFRHYNLSRKTLADKLQQIDEREFYKIYNLPNEENLNKLLRLLDVPLKLFNINTRDPKTQNTEQSLDFLSLVNFFKCQEDISVVLAKMINTGLNIYDAPYSAFQARCRKHQHILQERYSILNKISNKEYVGSHSNPFEEDFPIIFVTESLHIEPYGREYRSKMALKLGININLLATNTEENRQKLLHYLKDNHLSKIQVVLFEELKNPSFRPTIRKHAPEIYTFELQQKSDRQQLIKHQEANLQSQSRPGSQSGSEKLSSPIQSSYQQQILQVVNRLNYEVKHSFFYFNIERKKVKIAKLKELCELLKTNSVRDSINQIKNEPRVTQGFFSSRTKTLLNNLLNQESQQKTSSC